MISFITQNLRKSLSGIFVSSSSTFFQFFSVKVISHVSTIATLLVKNNATQSRLASGPQQFYYHPLAEFLKSWDSLRDNQTLISIPFLNMNRTSSLLLTTAWSASDCQRCSENSVTTPSCFFKPLRNNSVLVLRDLRSWIAPSKAVNCLLTSEYSFESWSNRLW